MLDRQVPRRGIGATGRRGTLRSVTPELQARRSDPRYQRLMEVTREAASGGYEHVSMRAIARAAQMSMTTIYQYCHSKDHLIAEAHLDWMEQFSESLVARPPRGRSAKTRVLAVIDAITESWVDEHVAATTLMRSIYALDPGVRDVRSLSGEIHRRIMDVALGDGEIRRRAELIEVIGHLLNSVTYGWVVGSYSPEDGRRTLRRDIGALIDAFSP